jgi:hypothetical protein
MFEPYEDWTVQYHAQNETFADESSKIKHLSKHEESMPVEVF